MQAGIRKIISESVLREEAVHDRDGLGLIVKRTDVHDLHAEPFVNGEELRLGAIELFLLRRRLHGPVEIFPCDEIRQTNNGDPVEPRFIGVIYAFRIVLPPEALERRDNIIKISFLP